MHRPLAWTVSIVALVPLVGCGGYQAGPAAGGSSLIYARGGDSHSLDPIADDSGESIKVVVNLFDTLVAYAEDTADLVPGVAESWETSEDGRTWTFHLRPGIRFHDGTPLDADAVAFSLRRMIDDDNPWVFGARPYEQSYQMIESVEPLDSHTVRFQLAHPSAVFLANLAMFPASIVSPTAVKERGEAFARNPVGSGPFRFTLWEPDQRIVLRANFDYWDGPPGIDTLVFKQVTENPVRTQQLMRGEIDLADNLRPADRELLAEAPGVVIQEEPGMNLAYLALNCDKPPLDDARVRRALYQGIDKEKILKLVYRDVGRTAVNPVPPTMWGYHEGIEDYPYDPEAARRGLAEAGVGDGLRLELWTMTNARPYMPDPPQVAQVIQEDLKQLGIDVRVVANDLNVHFESLHAGKHQMALIGWSTDNADPDNFLYPLLDQDNAVAPAASNVCFFRSDRLHELLIAGQRELDREKRLTLYHQAQEIIHQETPMVPLMHVPILVAQREHVKDYRLHPTGLVRLRRARIQE
jgi:peptide/nickel transport system substrate-binding protein